MDDKYRAELIKTYRNGLLQDTVPFWLTHGVDQQYGGVMTALDRRGNVIDTDKGVWQQGRFVWLLGELYNRVEPRQEWLHVALQSIKFMDEHCIDPDDGRMWFHVTRDGSPIRKRRYSFSESFASIAYGEMAMATGDSIFADKAISAFGQFVQNSSDKTIEDTLSLAPKYTDTRPTCCLAIPMITIATAQELRDSIDFPEAHSWIDRSIEKIERDHLNKDLQCVLETVGVNGEVLDHFDGRLLNPGHAIEAAWFILREAKYRNDSQLVDLGCQILDWMWAKGWDSKFGGILYFSDAKGLPVQEYWHDMKFWWPQNEAIIATLYAYLITGDAKYAKWHQLAHDWAHQHFADLDFGEWFGYLHRDGTVSSQLKGNLWKGPFHLPRMQLTCWKLLEETNIERTN